MSQLAMISLTNRSISDRPAWHGMVYERSGGQMASVVLLWPSYRLKRVRL